MRALVVYESMNGSARELAEAIAKGLRASFDVRVARADQVRTAQAGTATLLVAGGPTGSAGGSVTGPDVTGPDTIARAEEDAGTRSPGAPEATGRREWFDELGTVPAMFAAFDTRADVRRLLTGAASVRIGRELRRRGSTPVVPPESFLVSRQGLKSGEEERARRWGEQIAEAARHAQPFPTTGAAL